MERERKEAREREGKGVDKGERDCMGEKRTKQKMFQTKKGEKGRRKQPNTNKCNICSSIFLSEITLFFFIFSLSLSSIFGLFKKRSLLPPGIIEPGTTPTLPSNSLCMLRAQSATKMSNSFPTPVSEQACDLARSIIAWHRCIYLKDARLQRVNTPVIPCLELSETCNLIFDHPLSSPPFYFDAIPPSLFFFLWYFVFSYLFFFSSLSL